jgi:hypothetical protein
MEILAHVNKRIKGQAFIKLPLKELLPLVALPAADQPAAPASQAMVRSFGLVYLEMAFERATPQERLEGVSAEEGEERR